MPRVEYGAAHQTDKRQEGKFGELPNGTYPITLRWEIRTWENSRFGKEGQRRNLRLKVLGQNMLEAISTGTAPEWLLVGGDGRWLESPPGEAFQISKNTPGGKFFRKLEEALAGQVDSDLGAHDGIVVTIKRDEYDGMGPDTIPIVVAVQAGQVTAQPSTTPAGMDDPTGHRAWAKATILALMNGKVKQALAELEPDEIAKHLPAAVTTGDDQLAVVKLVMSPAYLKTQDGWLYDEAKHTVVVF